MFIDIAGKSVCLIYGANVTVIKKLNPRKHFETKHQDKLKNLNAEQKLQKVEELKNLTSQQTFFTKAKIQSEENWQKCSSGQPFNVGRFLKN